MAQYLYLITPVPTATVQAPVKIGVTGNPAARLKMIQTGCSFRIHFREIWSYRGLSRYYARMVEKIAHAAIAGERLTGEWFDAPADETRTLIIRAHFYTFRDADSIPEPEAEEMAMGMLCIGKIFDDLGRSLA